MCNPPYFSWVNFVVLLGFVVNVVAFFPLSIPADTVANSIKMDASEIDASLCCFG
jgi:hypothetical protein